MFSSNELDFFTQKVGSNKTGSYERRLADLFWICWITRRPVYIPPYMFIRIMSVCDRRRSFLLLFAWDFWLHTEVNVFKWQTWDCVDVMSNLQTKTETRGSHLFSQIIRSNSRWSATQKPNHSGSCDHDTNKSGCVLLKFTAPKDSPLNRSLKKAHGFVLTSLKIYLFWIKRHILCLLLTFSHVELPRRVKTRQRKALIILQIIWA